MKLHSKADEPSRRASRSLRLRAFTYIELLVASTVFLFVALALVGSNVSGARISRIVQQQSNGQRIERAITTLLRRDIAQAQRVEVGSGDFLTLTVPTNSPMVGNAMRLTYVDGGATNKRTYYWVDGVVFTAVNASLPITIVLNDVTNPQPFSIVDPISTVSGPASAQPLTNHAGRALVHVNFQLSTVGAESFVLGPNTEFQGNRIQFYATQRGF